jgi:hypothetical protein
MLQGPCSSAACWSTLLRKKAHKHTRGQAKRAEWPWALLWTCIHGSHARTSTWLAKTTHTHIYMHIRCVHRWYQSPIYQILSSQRIVCLMSSLQCLPSYCLPVRLAEPYIYIYIYRCIYENRSYTVNGTSKFSAVCVCV